MNDNVEHGTSSFDTPIPGTPATASSADTAVAALTQWAKEKRKWLETLVFQATNLRRNLSESELTVVYGMLQTESGLTPSGSATAPTPQTSARATAGFQSLSLKELSRIENVNALAAGQRLIFHDKLTIFFGENGSGKSGYARIMKRMSGARSAEDIIPNVFGSNPGSPSAEITYRLDLKEETLVWSDELGIEPLIAMQVFDGRAASIHLDDDLAYSYTPRELDSFDYVQDGLERIGDKLASEAAEKRAAVTGYVNALQPGSVIFTIATDTAVNDRAARATHLAELSGEEVVELHTLPRDIDALRSGSVAAEIELRKQRSRLIETLAWQLETGSAFSPEQYFQAVTELQQSTDLERRVTSEAFAGLGIPKLLEPSWRRLVLAAEDYIRDSHPNPHYPEEGEECVYCRQPLQSAAVELLRRYKDFCNSSAQEAITRANRKLATVAAPFLQLDTRALAETQALLQTADDAILRRAVTAFGNLQLLRDAIVRKESPEFTDAVLQSAELAKEMRLQISQMQQSISDLSQQEIGRQATVGKRAERLSELRERSALARLIPQLRTYDVNLELMSRAEEELSNFMSYKKSLTLIAKDISEKLLNEAFQKKFGEECECLRAPDVKLTFPGRHGKVIRQKTVGTGHKLSSILSEGEQKAIALADFLAELSLRPERVSVVFDDPVTSLDYRRIGEVSQRLANLTQQCQVIVFTHNIMFVAELMEAMGGKDLLYYDIRQTTCPGYVSVGTNPRIDSFNKIKTRISSAVQEAKKLSNAEEQRKAVEVIYEHIRSACEVFVEQELLFKLSERFLPNLKMTVLGRIKYDKLQPAANVTLEVFERACRYIPGHSQPLETLSIVPTLAEAEKDWNKLLEAKKIYDS
jgi:energy-coupling factor transporter ATP-binding protein EcfA2